MNYQERVSTRADVQALYKKVIENPAIARYRGYTESKSYGWDPVTEDYMKKEGEVWFDNPAYDPTFIPEGESNSGDAELLDEKLTEREGRIAELENTVSMLETAFAEQEGRVTAAEARVKAAEDERDDAKEALIEIRRALLLVAQLAGVK